MYKDVPISGLKEKNMEVTEISSKNMFTNLFANNSVRLNNGRREHTISLLNMMRVTYSVLMKNILFF